MAMATASHAGQARIVESFCQASHGEMHSSSMYPCLRIPQQWSSKAAFFSCTRRPLNVTVKSARYNRNSISPMAMAPSGKVFHGECFVVQENIDTDQIIPAEHLTLVPSKRDEYEKLGSLALCGLPSVYPRFVQEGEMKTKYPVIIAGANFGCGSSREHAPVALGASGVRAVVAESYARIFFRNSVATGELYPVETEVPLSKECKTGDIVTVDLDHSILINHTQDKQYNLKPLGDAGPVIDAGGLFAYARKTGIHGLMIICLTGSFRLSLLGDLSSPLSTRVVELELEGVCSFKQMVLGQLTLQFGSSQVYEGFCWYGCCNC